jgi:hypothetical protein
MKNKSLLALGAFAIVLSTGLSVKIIQEVRNTAKVWDKTNFIAGLAASGFSSFFGWRILQQIAVNKKLLEK